MIVDSFIRFLLFTGCFLVSSSYSQTVMPILNLTPAQFVSAIRAGRIDVIGDIRSQASWNEGRVPGATHLGGKVAKDVLKGCERCSIAMYCASWAASRVALLRLRRAGFNGMLYNVGSADDLAAAGIPLTTEYPSVTPPCTIKGAAACRVVYNGPMLSPSAPSTGTGATTSGASTTTTRGGTRTGQGSYIVTAPRPSGGGRRRRLRREKEEAAAAKGGKFGT